MPLKSRLILVPRNISSLKALCLHMYCLDRGPKSMEMVNGIEIRVYESL